ncbi:HGGxSTG domain-containing protein [Tsuneonella sp. SYSU-LHT278]|uniref:HGGxSTG domain-containing protein n=1 Tax=Tsuneonella sediminis TaxID=3416089 RepID=UPI003F7AD402
MKDRRDKPMQPQQLAQAPRCLAKTRKGTECQSPAVRGRKRCRMHGGAAGSGARPGNENARKHGRYSAENLAIMAGLRAVLTEGNAMLDGLSD